MAWESDYGAAGGPNKDELLAGIVAAWPGLPPHICAKIDDLVHGRPRERACPRCRVGRTTVKTSHRKASSQLRTMQCNQCGFRFLQAVPREDVATRRRGKSAP